jgi:hypothetical protein
VSASTRCAPRNLLASLLDMRADEKQQILELNELPAKLQAGLDRP